MMSSAFLFFYFSQGNISPAIHQRPLPRVQSLMSHSLLQPGCEAGEDSGVRARARLVLCRWVLWWEATLNLFPIMLPGQSRMINVPLPSDPWRVFLPVLTGPARAVTSHVAPLWLAERMVNSRYLTSHFFFFFFFPPAALTSGGVFTRAGLLTRDAISKKPSPKPLAGAFKCKDLLYLQLSPLERTFLTPLLFEHSDVLSYFQVQQLKKIRRHAEKTSRVTSLHQLQVW